MTEAEDAQSKALYSRHVVIPGQLVATSTGEGEGGFLRGHGTYIEYAKKSFKVATDTETSTNDKAQDTPQRLMASVSGTVERVNKLISVTPFSPTVYSGQVGDLIVGRIISVGASRWKVRLGPGCREATLPLSGVNLPYGIQRIRTAEDALGMRQLFREGDLLSAEVQQIQHDGVLSLHTRSLRYGKLENGCLIQVYPTLIPRRKQHFCTLDDTGVDLILGNNGWIWIQRSIPPQFKTSFESEEDTRPLAETQQLIKQRHASTALLPDERVTIARVRNLIEAFKLLYIEITAQSILDGIKHVQEMKVNEILSSCTLKSISNAIRGTFTS